MTTPAPAARIHLMISFVLVMCAAVGGACFGLLPGGRVAAVVAGGVAGLGAGIGSFLSRRQVVAFFRPAAVPVDGYVEGIADAVLVTIATYEAAVFFFLPDGVSLSYLPSVGLRRSFVGSAEPRGSGCGCELVAV
ncbi:hypothetical protein ACFXKF_26795 [Streptomyces scopuliridis]|uniref:hypothetical protein n=1 Tax=Streptomyces scopuliridis TaxID=452529 RepID=UPI0036B5366D